MVFKDRMDAAQRLAKKLESLKNENVVVLAIPRGGVVLGDVIAKALGFQLDVIVSRKIGAPHNPELAIGAVLQDGSFFSNDDLLNSLHISQSYLDVQIDEQVAEVKQRLMKFRGRTDYDLAGKTVVIVDDGVATGATVIVALKWVEKQKPKRIIVAVPVGPRDTVEKLRRMSEVVVLHIPKEFGAVGEFYDSFEQVEDDAVIEILSSYNHELGDVV